MAPEATPAKKAKWSAARKKAAKETRSAAAEEASGGGGAKRRRFAASGRLVLAGAECGYCGASATCEVDPQDESAAYCRRCWSEWEQGEEAERAREVAAADSARRRERAAARGGHREEQQLSEGVVPGMLLQRRRLFALLLERREAGVLLEDVPRLLWPRLRREGITWSDAELRGLRACTADFVTTARPDGGGGGVVLRLAEHVSAPGPAAGLAAPPRVLLILDVNHLLCERHPWSAPPPAESDLLAHAHTYLKGNALVWERPWAAQFIEWCMRRFAVAVWSSGKRKNVLPIVARLFSFRRCQAHLLFTWAQEECTIDTGTMVSASSGAAGPAGGAGPLKPLIRKDLARVFRHWPAWDASCTAIVDDDPLKCSHNAPHTAVHPAKWRALAPPPGSAQELAPHGPLCAYLERLAAAADTQAFIRETQYHAPTPAPAPAPPATAAAPEPAPPDPAPAVRGGDIPS